MHFWIEGEVIGAVRMTQRSKFEDPRAIAYLGYKDLIGTRATLAQAGEDPIPKGTPIAVTVLAYVRERKIDLDNIVKAVLDGCNKVLWHDDDDVREIFAQKNIIAFEEKVFVSVRTIDDLGRTPGVTEEMEPQPAAVKYPKGFAR